MSFHVANRQVGKMDRNLRHKHNIGMRKPRGPSTSKLGNCSDRIIKLALPSMHIVAAVLRDHFKKLSRDQIGRLERLIQQIQEIHRKNNRKELMRTFDDFAQSEKEQIMEIIQNVENKKHNITLEGIDFSKMKRVPIKSASDMFLIDSNRKLNLLYANDNKENFECKSSDDFLNSQSEVSSFNMFKLASSLQKSVKKKSSGYTRKRAPMYKEIGANVSKPNIKSNNSRKSTIAINAQYSEQTVRATALTTLNNKSKMELSSTTPKEDEREHDMKILFVNNLERKQMSCTTQSLHESDIEHLRRNFSRIRQYVRPRRKGEFQSVQYYQHYYKQLVQILQNIYDILIYELCDALTTYLVQVLNLDNYIYYLNLPYRSYLKYKPILLSSIHGIKLMVDHKNFDLATYTDNVNNFCSNVLNLLFRSVIGQPITAVMGCLSNLLFSYNGDDLFELNSKYIKALKARGRHKRGSYIYSVQVQNIYSILQ